MDAVDAALVRLHRDATEFAVAVNATVAHQFNGRHPYPLAGGALHRLGADTVAFHEAVLALCATGWVACSAPLLRTLLDMLLSTAIITEGGSQAEMRFPLHSLFPKGDVVRGGCRVAAKQPATD